MNKSMKLKYYIKIYIAGMYEITTNHGVLFLFNFIIDFVKIKNEISKILLNISIKYRSNNPGESHEKYLDSSIWIFECLLRFYRLKLHKLKHKINILDLGTGAGYFPFICRFYGHNVESIDILDNEMYNEIIDAFKLHRYGQYITYNSSLITRNRYDIISAFMICFNGHKKTNLWHIMEWETFLNNIKNNNLADNGEIYLSFNAESFEEPVNRELLSYFERRNGDVINSSTVHIKSNYIF